MISTHDEPLHLFLARSDDFNFLVELDLDRVVDQVDALALVPVIQAFCTGVSKLINERSEDVRQNENI